MLPRLAQLVLEGKKVATLRPGGYPLGLYSLVAGQRWHGTVEIYEVAEVDWGKMDEKARLELVEEEGMLTIEGFEASCRAMPTWGKPASPYEEFVDGKRVLFKHKFRIVKRAQPELPV